MKKYIIKLTKDQYVKLANHVSFNMDDSELEQAIDNCDVIEEND